MDLASQCIDIFGEAGGSLQPLVFDSSYAGTTSHAPSERQTMENQEQHLTHWKKLVDPRYIGAYALPDGNDLTVTIQEVRRETVTMMGGKKEDHSIMYLVGQKPMILNATNSKTIHKLYGPYIEHWAGQQITLFASTAKMGGELVECLRIRPTVPTKAKKTISSERLQAAFEQIRAGAYSIGKLRGNFELTPDQETALADFQKEQSQ